MPLQPTLDGYHDASGYMCGGSVLPGPTVVLRTPQMQPRSAATSPEPVGAHPIVWWEQVLGELRYVATNLTGYRNLFSHIQEALCHVDGKKVVITRGIHQDLAEFQWLTEDLVQRPT